MFLPSLASGMILIKNLQLTVFLFKVRVRSSELFNKEDAHCLMSILAGHICVSSLLPDEHLLLLQQRHKIKQMPQGAPNDG